MGGILYYYNRFLHRKVSPFLSLVPHISESPDPGRAPGPWKLFNKCKLTGIKWHLITYFKMAYTKHCSYMFVKAKSITKQESL